MKKISIVVPVYFNEQSLLPLFERIQQVEKDLFNKGIEVELIFVDDGSGDHSFNELVKIKEKRPETKLIKLTRNFGAVHASKTGIQFVTGDAFLILAADLQDPPELILQMVDEWQKGSKFVICVRNKRGDPFLKKRFAALYYKLLRTLVDKKFPQGGYDLALMDKMLLPYVQNSSKNIYTPVFCHWLGFKPKIIYYDRKERQFGKSMWTFSKSIKASIDAILGFSIIPIRLVSMIGLMISLISFFYGGMIAVNALLGKTIVPGFATTVTLIAFLCGLIIVMLGMIGEYLWRIFDEVNKRPETVIDDVFL